MATININSIVSYYNTGTNTSSGVAGVTGKSSAAVAKTAAKAAADAAIASIGGGMPSSGGSSSTTSLRFGSNLGNSSGTTSTPGAALDPDEGTYEGWCNWSGSRTSTIYQLKLKFTLPSGISASNITSAILTFKATNNAANEYTFNVCAPKTSEQTQYYKYSDTNSAIDINKKVAFNSIDNMSENTYTITITDIFKQCITNGQGWITILEPRDTPASTHIMTVSGSPSITYDTSYSDCGAPTSVSSNISIQKPGGTVSISWSGATAGTSNPIAGYRVYYNIGSAPTISTTTYVDVSTTSYSFSIPSGDTNRGKTYYFKVLTKGTVNNTDSNLSSAQATVKVNSLPAAPTVNVDKSRIKSTGSTTIKFTVTAGGDSDTGQTKTLYYATSSSGTKTKFTSPLSQTLSAAAEYYFWTYDGLEYSSSTSKSITRNNPPTIGSITMSNVATYTPSTIVNTVERKYVKNINGSASNVTKDSAAILTYQWKLQYVSGVTANITTSSPTKNISTATSLSNIDVTSYGATFNTAYRLVLVVTDDLGESDTAYSSTIYGIPAAPTITIINRKKDTNKGGNTNDFHFDDGLRFKYSNNNTGLTRELQYSTSSNFNSYSTVSLTGTVHSDFTPTSLVRGTTYYFRIKYTCNSKTTTSAVSSGYMRAKDITPTNLIITPESEGTIKPYTQSSLSFSFGGQPTSWVTTQDVATSYSGIYTINLKYNNSSKLVTSIGNNSNGVVSGSIDLSLITTANWIDLLGLSNAPNKSYDIILEITATNGFGSPFTATKTFRADFAEGVYTTGTPVLQIKTGTSEYTEIPSSYNYAENQSGKTELDRYHIFEGQTLQLSVSGIKCYANQSATIYFMNGSTSLGSVAIAATDWNAPTGTNRIYTLNSAKTIEYVVPANTVTSYSKNVRNYSVKVVLNNGKSKLSTETGESNGNLNTCFHTRFSPNSINFKIAKINENSNIFTIKWDCSDWGSITKASCYSNDYSSVSVQLRTSNSADSGYSDLGTRQTLTPSSRTGNISIQNSSLVEGDKIYFGATVKVVLKFQAIDVNGATKTPSGTTTYSYSYKNLYIFYRETPNLLYGKNFFALNANQPTSGLTDQILELHTTTYQSDNSTITRNKIYFENGNTYFTITSNDLEIDCGSW